MCLVSWGTGGSARGALAGDPVLGGRKLGRGPGRSLTSCVAVGGFYHCSESSPNTISPCPAPSRAELPPTPTGQPCATHLGAGPLSLELRSPISSLTLRLLETLRTGGQQLGGRPVPTAGASPA